MEYVHCNLCGGGLTREVAALKGMKIVKCLACGLIYVNPRYGEDELGKSYQEGYLRGDDACDFGYEDYLSMKESLTAMFRRHLNKIEAIVPQKGRLLDVGCAVGFLLQEAESRGWEAWGVEISSEAARFGKKELGVRIIQGTLNDTALDGASFDVVTLFDVLEHTLNPLGELREVHRILKPGGYVFLTLPNAGSLPARIMGRYWYGYKKVKEHFYYFTPPTAKRILAESGISFVEVSRSHWSCTLGFLVSKLEPYSAALYRSARFLVKLFKAEKRNVNFGFIDMMVIGRKELSEDTTAE